MDLRNVIGSLHGGVRPSIREAVSLFHHIALVYLRHKDAAGALMHAHLGLSLEDLALDCIAGLFERDHSGRFPVLARYYEEIQWQTLDEVTLNGATRRLVFSAVNQELYRNYREADPTLHRIIRNIKDAAEAVQGVGITQIGRDNCVTFSHDPGAGLLPVAPPEYLSPYVSSVLAKNEDLRAVLTELKDLLGSQECYRPAISIVRLALMIRETFLALAHDTAYAESTPPAVEEQLLLSDIESLIARSVKTTGERFRANYVGRGKVSADRFEVYVNVAREVMQADFTDAGDRRLSFFERTRNHIPGLTEEEYRSEHRSVLEYLVKTARSEYLEAVRHHCA